VLRRGAVIPAHLLALDADRKLDVRAPARPGALLPRRRGRRPGRGRALDAVRHPRAGLYEPVLDLAMQTARDWTPLGGQRPLFMIAGVAGRTVQATAEATTAKRLGYHAGSMSLAAMKGSSEDELDRALPGGGRCAMPLVGFYLQPAVGGIELPARFWERFAAIDNVVAIKMAPFNRYRTLDVLRGVVAAGAEERISLYTGNDDHIVLDLALPFDIPRDGRQVRLRIRGGLLGHWSVWTRRAVEIARAHPCGRGRRRTSMTTCLRSTAR
jgi:hypothetical protein